VAGREVGDDREADDGEQQDETDAPRPAEAASWDAGGRLEPGWPSSATD